MKEKEKTKKRLLLTEHRQAEAQLRESESLYRALAENSLTGIYLFRDGRYLFANEMYSKISGYPWDDLRFMDPADLIAPQYRKQASERLIKRLAGEDVPLDCETQILRKDGAIRDVHMKLTRIMYEGEPTVLGNIIDTTERRGMEEALSAEKQRFQILCERSPVGVMMIAEDGAFKYLNPRFSELFGYDMSDLPDARTWFSKAYPDPAYRHHVSSSWISDLESFKKRERNHKVFNVTCKDGTEKTVGFMAVQLEAGEYSVLCEDITELKLAEEALQESEERHRTAIENSPDGVAIVQGGQLLFVNQRFAEIFGYGRPEEIVGKPLSTVLDADDLKQMEEVNYEKQKDGPVTLRHEFKGIRKGGEPILIEVSATRITYRGEAASLVYLRDITERKRKEQEITSLQEQLRQSQKMEAIGLLAGGIAHDFGNLLAVVQGYSELSLLKLPPEAPVRENIEEVVKAGKRAMDLIRRLLAFSRRQIFQTSVLDLNTIVRDLEKMLRRIIGEDIELVTLLADDPGKIEADRGQIEQILLNLAVNARDAMPSGGKLTIETTNIELDKTYARSHAAVKPGRYVMVSVSDTGVGMTPEVRERVFEPFFTTKEIGKGTGLGLSTVYGIVKQSGGNIWVYSEPGYGTTFKIYLPRLGELLKREREMKIVEEPLRGNETILVVEDEEKVLKMVTEILREQGYKVLEAPQGENALLIAGQHKDPIHLMVTDVVMPGMNGRELAGRLAPLHPEMKVLYMSGFTDDVIVHHGVLEGGINFIQKPFTVAGLARKVREVLEQKPRLSRLV